MRVLGVDSDTNEYAVLITGIFGFFLALFSWVFYEMFKCTSKIEENDCDHHGEGVTVNIEFNFFFLLKKKEINFHDFSELRRLS